MKNYRRTNNYKGSMKNKWIILLALPVLFSACKPSYQKEGGQHIIFDR